MAKSLRASSKVKARNARRYNEDTDYAVTQAARLNAISQRLQARVKGPRVAETIKHGSDEDGEGQENGEAGDEESKGWYLCFDWEGKEYLSKKSCSNPEVERWEEEVTEVAVDVQLLGLVDAETIGLSNQETVGKATADDVTASPVDWMFYPLV